MRRILAFAVVLLASTPAYAVTTGDFLDKMNADTRAGFMSGALDMLAYRLSKDGQGQKATCALDWYFKGSGPQDVATTFAAHKDLPAVGVLQVLVDRHCK